MPRKGPSLGSKYNRAEETEVTEVIEEMEIDTEQDAQFIRNESVEIPEGYIDPIMNFIPDGNVIDMADSKNISIKAADIDFEPVYDEDGRRLNFNEIQEPVDWSEKLSHLKDEKQTEEEPEETAPEEVQEETNNGKFFGKKKNKRNRKVNAETIDELNNPELLKQRILLQEAEEENKKKKKNKQKNINKPEESETKEDEKKKNTKNIRIPKGYPKEYFDPTDAEVDDKDGKTYYYFNIEKTLRLHNWMFITRLFSLEKLEEWTYDNPHFDSIAQKQHATAERLNNASSEEQYRHDQRNKMMKVGSLATVVFMFVCLIFLHTIPSHRFENAMDHLVKEEYEQGYNIFSSLGMKYNSYIYAKYAEGQLRLADAKESSAGTAGKDLDEEEKKKNISEAIEKYDGAKDCFEKLIDYYGYFTKPLGLTEDEASDRILELVNECEYSKGRMLYQAQQFEEAATIFKNIHNYSDATENYYKTMYEIGDDYYEKGDYFEAIDHFYPISQAKYSDSETRLKELAQELYDKALANYNRKQYEDAIETFAFLSNYNYLDSQDLIKKCKYNYALDFYKAKNYEKASENLTDVVAYKDSIAIKKDCTYRLGVIAYNNKPVDSIRYFNSIKGFKNSEEILNSDNLVLFGEWEITELNGAPITQTSFTFSGNGLFKTKSANIVGVAISTDSTEYPYKWNGHGYTTSVDNTTYEMDMKISSNREVKLICKSDGKEYEYSCKRTKTYLDMINSGIEKEDNDSNLTLNDKLKIIINKYISNKTDQIYSYNGINIDATANSIKIESVDDTNKESKEDKSETSQSKESEKE